MTYADYCDALETEILQHKELLVALRATRSSTTQDKTMRTRLYQMYDLTAEAVAGPIVSEKKDGPAIRAFHAILADKRTLPGQYPEHFVLCYLGDQDENTGFIDAAENQTVIATGRGWLDYANHQAKDPEMATWGQTQGDP